MTLHVKDGGTWKTVQRPYVKKNGAWYPVMEAYIKSAGVWESAFLYDVTPTDPPMLSLQVIDGRYIRVGTRLPSVADDTSLDLIRILVGTATAYSSSPTDATYISDRDREWGEPWSQWYYRHYLTDGTLVRNHKDSSVWNYKDYPVNAGDSTNLKGDRDYRFSAWALDENGNWSTGTHAKIAMPAEGGSKGVVKSARFQPNQLGTWTNGSTWAEGPGVVQTGPIKHATWYYGHQIKAAITDNTNIAITVRNAQVRLYRTTDSPGVAEANVYLYRHAQENPGASEPANNEVTKVGTLKKGEAKWFDLPTSFHNNLREGLCGMGLYHKDPAKASGNPDDVLTIRELDFDEGVVRVGEFALTWVETPK